MVFCTVATQTPTSRKYKREKGSVYITVPPNLREHRIKEIRVLPKQKGKFLDAAFVYESGDEQINVDDKNAILVWNHNEIMRRGALGLANKLDARLVQSV